MNCLIERVRDALVKNESETYADQALAATRVVLAHFSERKNITESMMFAARDAVDHDRPLMCRNTIVAAMAAALKEIEP